MSTKSDPKRPRWTLPHLGQRIIKTTVAVFLCLLISYLRGYTGSDMSTESSITAIVCMQPYVRGTREYALNRFTGTLIGTFWGLVFLFLLMTFPYLSAHMALVYLGMAIGVLLCLYSSVLLGKHTAASLAAIVFLCIVISFPEIEAPLEKTMRRIQEVFIGTAVSILVNVFRLPREKHRDRVFFIRSADLIPDRFSQVSSVALFRLNYLYEDGARICLMSEHAPAFFTQQMSAARLNTPLIVMDGAAIYDVGENRYLYAETIPEEDSLRLRERLNELGKGYFVYTIHKNKTCIFHQGKLSIEEKLLFDRMRRTPYRSYLDGENYDLNEVVYFKIIGREEELEQILYHLRRSLPKGKLRSALRPEVGAPGMHSLYIYSHSATMEQAEKQLMQMLRTLSPTELQPVEIRLRSGYRSERDAIHVLNRLSRAYEPIRLPWRRKAKTEESNT